MIIKLFKWLWREIKEVYEDIKLAEEVGYDC